MVNTLLAVSRAAICVAKRCGEFLVIAVLVTAFFPIIFALMIASPHDNQ